MSILAAFPIIIYSGCVFPIYLIWLQKKLHFIPTPQYCFVSVGTVRETVVLKRDYSSRRSCANWGQQGCSDEKRLHSVFNNLIAIKLVYSKRAYHIIHGQTLKGTSKPGTLGN